MSTNLQTLITNPLITVHLPVRVIQYAIEDGETWEVTRVSGTVRVIDQGVSFYWYKERSIERDDSEYADHMGNRSQDKFRIGRHGFRSLTEAKKYIDG